MIRILKYHDLFTGIYLGLWNSIVFQYNLYYQLVMFHTPSSKSPLSKSPSCSKSSIKVVTSTGQENGRIHRKKPSRSLHGRMTSDHTSDYPSPAPSSNGLMCFRPHKTTILLSIASSPVSVQRIRATDPPPGSSHPISLKGRSYL